MHLNLPQRNHGEAPAAYVDRLIAVLENAKDTKPKRYECRFIEPGLVHYREHGTVLVTKEALDRMVHSMVGAPVVNEFHRDVLQQRFRHDSDGIVTRAWFNEADGWYWAEFMVWDEATQRNIESKAYSVSCAYTPSDVKDGGTHNNIPFEAEVLSGQYTHLAVVNNPRYEGARVYYNSNDQGGSTMFKFLRLLQGKKEPVEVTNAAESFVEVGGKKVLVKDLIALHNAKEQARAAAAAKPIELDTIVEVDGKEISVKELVDLHNAQEAEQEAARKAKDEAERKAAEELKNANDKAAKEAADKAAADAEAARKEAELKNQNGKHFEDLAARAALRGHAQTPQLVTRRDQAAEGAKRYGSEK